MDSAQNRLQVRANEKCLEELDSPKSEEVLFNIKYTKMLECYDECSDIEQIGDSSACHF